MKINKITGVLINILIFIGIVCILCIPLLLKVTIPYYNGVIYYSYMAFLFISGIFTIYILYNIRRMYKTLFLGNPFVKENIKYLNNISISCMFITLIYFIKCFVVLTFATIIIVIVFAVGSPFCLTLKDIFKQAIYYKEENDWTV